MIRLSGDERKKVMSGSFYKRMLKYVFWLMFLALFMGVIVISVSSYRATSRLNDELMKQNLSTTASNFDQEINNLENQVVSMFVQKDVLETAVGVEPLTEQLTAYNNARSALNSLIAGSPYIQGVAIYKSNGDSISASLSDRYLEYHDMESCLSYYGETTETLAQVSSKWKFLGSNPADSGTGNFSFVNLRVLNDLSNHHRSSACMCVFLPEQKLRRLYSFFGGKCYIVDAEGKIVSCADQGKIGEQEDEAVMSQLTAGGGDVIHVRDEGNDTVYAVKLDSVGCWLVARSESSILRTTFRTVVITVVILLAFGVAALFILSRMIASALTSSLSRLKTTMEKARAGELDVRAAVEGDDEISYLASTFNDMMDSMNAYMDELHRGERQKRESELRLLQAEINPHLLYNTIDSALYLMTRNDNGKAIAVLEELSRFFKLSLSHGAETVTVGTEIEHVRSYLSLQRLCRNKDIELKICGDDSLRDCPALHMTLEPIVENSVLHAFECPQGGDCITIELRRDGDDLMIRISDNGVGMEEKEVTELREMVSSPVAPAGSFGLWNVNQRIRYHYGDGHGIEIVSELGEGTCVTVRIPYQVKPMDKGNRNV